MCQSCIVHAMRNCQHVIAAYSFHLKMCVLMCIKGVYDYNRSSAVSQALAAIPCHVGSKEKQSLIQCRSPVFTLRQSQTPCMPTCATPSPASGRLCYSSEHSYSPHTNHLGPQACIHPTQQHSHICGCRNITETPVLTPTPCERDLAGPTNCA